MNKITKFWVKNYSAEIFKIKNQLFLDFVHDFLLNFYILIKPNNNLDKKK